MPRSGRRAKRLAEDPESRHLSCQTFGLNSLSQLVKSITRRQSNERRNHPHFRISRSEDRRHHQHRFRIANGTISHCDWPHASSVNRILVARAADHLRAYTYDVTNDVDDRVVNGGAACRDLQLRCSAMGRPANFHAGKFAAVSNENSRRSWSRLNTVRVAKNNPFVLSLSKGLMDETLRQIQGERGLIKQY